MVQSKIDIKAQIDSIKNSYATALAHANSAEALEQVRVIFLGRQGHVSDLMAHLKNASLEEKRICGPLLNELKQELQQTFQDKETSLRNAQEQAVLAQQKSFDVTAYQYQPLAGSLHVYTHLIEHFENIFMTMGYEIASGPEVETEYHNFNALNIPENHPARDMQDTFWTRIPHLLMRTQTSPVQVREMEKQGAPVAIVAPGRVYRNEQIDASHSFMFTQIEGLVVDKQISLGNLLATIKHFLALVFERDDIAIRARPGYFPFVEPGIEIDAACPFCSSGCSICKKTGWIELMGSGLVHPHVLRTCGVDPDIYAGFAFGLGIERIAMIKYGITDIRLFHTGRTDFLKQF